MNTWLPLVIDLERHGLSLRLAAMAEPPSPERVIAVPPPSICFSASVGKSASVA